MASRPRIPIVLWALATWVLLGLSAIYCYGGVRRLTACLAGASPDRGVAHPSSCLSEKPSSPDEEDAPSSHAALGLLALLALLHVVACARVIIFAGVYQKLIAALLLAASPLTCPGGFLFLAALQHLLN
jgi:MYXO-CTERM domain-containing protein